jgi:hypothetical protein
VLRFDETGDPGYVNVLGRGDVHTELQWGNLKERDYLENIGIDGRIILKWVLNKSVRKPWTGLNGLR